jgi:uncharacterized membrane protein
MIAYFEKLLTAEFMRPDAFWLLCALPVFLLPLIKPPRAFFSTALRIVACALLVVALADPVDVDEQSQQELSALIDVSSSISPRAQRALTEQLLGMLQDGDTTLKLLPFAKAPAQNLIEINASDDVEDVLAQIRKSAATLDTGSTNIGAALDTSVARSKSSSLLLLSDGFETAGNASQVSRSLAAKGIRVFPLIPGERVFQQSKLSISSLHAPLTAKAGDKAAVRVAVRNTFSEETEATLEIKIDNKRLVKKRVSVPAGQERLVEVTSEPLTGGLFRVSAALELDDNSADEIEERHRWISVKEKSKVLLLSGSKADQRVIREIIRLKGYTLEDIVADGSKTIPSDFQNYSTIVFNNVAKRQLPRAFLPNLKKFVEKGGGLLVLGGDRSFGLGGYIKTPLEEVSPLSFVPPQTEKRRLTVAVVLVIDKSGSMQNEGRILAAKKAAFISIQTLKDDDFIGVVGFDQNPMIVIDLAPVPRVKRMAERRLINLTARGASNLYPALQEARVQLSASSASRKHIIILSDGQVNSSQTDAYIEEINRLRSNRISVSAVALGPSADGSFMKLLAKYGKGAYYHTLDASRLPQIFVQDIKVSTGEKTLNEQQNFSVGRGPGGLRSTNIRRFPPLRGFVETKPKKKAILELMTKKKGKLFPILASWKYGAGQVIVFTSDANGRWSSPWLRWKKFPTYWSQVLEAVKDRSGTKASEIDFDLRYRVNRKAIELDLAIFDKKLISQSSPGITAEVIEPGGDRSEVAFRSKKRGRYSAIIKNGKPGDYKLNIRYGDLQLPPLALTLDGESFGEAAGRGIDNRNLDEIAYLTGGTSNPDAKSVRGHTRVDQTRVHLFIPLVLLAAALILLEALIREGFLYSLFHRLFTRFFGWKSPESSKGRNKPAGVYHREAA